MAQRISRAKRRLAGQSLDQPGDLGTVLRVLYLALQRGLRRRLRPGGRGDPDHPAARGPRPTSRRSPGCSPSCCLHHARRASRTAPDGRLVPLARQDRTRWDTRLIAEGVGDPAARAGTRPARAVPGAGRDRRPARRCPQRGGDRLGPDRRVVRRARAPHRQPDRAPQPGGRRRGGRRAAGRPGVLADLDPDLPRFAAVAAHLRERAGEPERAAQLYADAAHAAASAAERDHLIREAARVRQVSGS